MIDFFFRTIVKLYTPTRSSKWRGTTGNGGETWRKLENFWREKDTNPGIGKLKINYSYPQYYF